MPAALPDAERLATRLATRQTSAIETLAERAGTTFADLFRTLEALDDAALARWLDLAVPAAEATQAAAASTGIGYVSNVATLYGHSLGDVAPVSEIIGDALRQGTTLVDEYHRPIVTARAAIARGRTFREAIEEGAAKASSLARTDIGLASRAGSTAAMRSTPAITGYRRVPDSKPCSFCLTISTHRYKVDTLAPAHANCTCGVVPIMSNGDPGASISAAAGRTLDEQKIEPGRVPVETSEIGPVTSGAAPEGEP